MWEATIAAPPDATAPRIGIVVPLYKHSVLVGDALASAIDQVVAAQYLIVVVNDGCPFSDTTDHLQAIRAAHPALLHYIVRPNGGLSAARNSGIDYLLSRFPSIEAIYFLDADNRLHPRGIAAAYDRLLADPAADWVYPNIDMFGRRENYDYCGPYSPLRHAFHNTCEAGSLVHRRVFDAGIRFDEAMRHGYEDWEFWLGAAGAGFRGVHEPHFGFEYRNRAESMLSQSKRDGAAILAAIRAKHPKLWDRDTLLALEEREAPRHAFVFLDADEVLFGIGAGGRQSLTRAAFETSLWRNAVAPMLAYLPPFLLFTTSDVFAELSASGVLAWAVYDAQLALADHNVACLQLEESNGRGIAVRAGGVPGGAHMLMMGRDLLVQMLVADDTSWIEQLPAAGPAMRAACRTLSLPLTVMDGSPAGGCAFGFLFRLMQWRRSKLRAGARQAWHWRSRSTPLPHQAHQEIQQRLGGQVFYVPLAKGAQSIGFVLPIAAHGGVERVAFNVAAAFAAGGWTTHLFMLGASRVELPEAFGRTFASINFLEGLPRGDWDDQSIYQGTALPATDPDGTTAHRLAGALGWLDVVVNAHCGALHCAAALLRRGGTLMVAHLHLLDLSPLGRPLGHPVLTLAYEHAYDLVVCGSERLLSWMRAAGVPDDKLVLTANAPGYKLAEAEKHAVLANRLTRRQADDRLRVLYLGRLDAQKRIDRVADVIAAGRQRGLPLDWRIVGAPTIDTQATLPQLIRDLAEPLVTSAASLTAVLAWADVLVLLSDFEGVPLSVLEAQRLGVCVIATDVGAMREVLQPGRTGLLVPPATAVADTVDLLAALLESPGLLPVLGQGAAASVRDWGVTCGAFLGRVSVLAKRREESTSF